MNELIVTIEIQQEQIDEFRAKIKEIKTEDVEILGMTLRRWTFRSCQAEFGRGEDWVTLTHIESTERNQGHATFLMMIAKYVYERNGKRFGSSVAIHPAMRHILQKLEIHEYRGDSL